MSSEVNQANDLPSESNKSSKKTGLIIGVLAVLISVFAVFLCKKDTPDENGDEEKQLVDYSYIEEKAKELGLDRDRIIDFVRKDIATEAYAGSARGALGTLWSKAGNDEDRASLLQALLAEIDIKGYVVRGEKGYGVQLEENNEVVSLSEENSEKWEPVAIQPDLLMRFSGDGDQEDLRISVADYLRKPLRVTTKGNQAKLLGLAGEVLWKGAFELEKGFSLHMTFSLGDEQSKVWRELIPAGSSMDTRSEHVVLLAPCKIDQSVFNKQTELLSYEFKNYPGAVDACQLALAHWYQSDKALVDLEKHFDVKAWYKEPRVLIGSVYFEEGSEQPVGYALDLRKNDIHASGEAEQALAFSLTRSAVEADLEARVMTEATGRRARSSIDVLLAQLGEWAPSSERRISDYEALLAGFYTDTNVGSILNMSSGEGLQISLTKLSGENALGIKLSEAINSHMEKLSELPWGILKTRKATPNQFKELAMELETLLGAASSAGFDYRPSITLTHSKDILKSPNVRNFQFRYDKEKKKSFVSWETQIIDIRKDGSYHYEIKDYWDEITNKPINNSFRINVPPNTYQSGNGVSSWHSQRSIYQGSNPFALSIKGYQELIKQGFTDVVAFHRDGSKSEPIRLYLLERKKSLIFINQERTEIPIIVVGGRPVSEKKGKQEWKDIELFDDPSTPYPDGLNKFSILDDPELPVINPFSGSYQAAVNGKILSEDTDHPVRDAQVSVKAAGVSAKSWPTGDFVLPIIKMPFDEFEVVVTHPEYETWAQTLNFKELETFKKLKEIKLKPKPREDKFAWIMPESLEDDLKKVKNKSMARFVRQSIEDNPHLQALVPLSDVEYGLGQDRAWLLLNRKSGHMTTVSAEGLHGVMSSGPALSLVGRLPGMAVKKARGAAISAYTGYIASWYAYSAGKIDAITEAMQGGDFSDLGHEHAMAFAMKFLQRMMDSTNNIFAKQAGVNNKAYKAGFLKGLEFFDKNPAYRGE